MQSLEYRIGNSRKPLYDATNTNKIYYSLFDDDIEDDNVEFPYGDELVNVKFEESSNYYLDALDDYIRADIVLPGIYVLHSLGKVNKRKLDEYGNPIGEKNFNPILDTSIY